MVLFELNISKIKNNIENYNTNYGKLKEQLDYTYSCLYNVDACWTDATAASFVKRLKTDDGKIEDYFDYLNKLYKQLDSFTDGICDIYRGYNLRNIKRIKFDNSRLSTCYNYLDRVNEILNYTIYKLKEIKPDMSSLREWNEKVNLVYRMINNVNSIKSKLAKFDKEIEKFLINSREKNSRLGAYEFDLKRVEYGYKVTDGSYSKSVSARDLISDDSFVGNSSSMTIQQNDVDKVHVKDYDESSGVQKETISVNSVDNSVEQVSIQSFNENNSNSQMTFNNQQLKINSQTSNTSSVSLDSSVMTSTQMNATNNISDDASEFNFSSNNKNNFSNAFKNSLDLGTDGHGKESSIFDVSSMQETYISVKSYDTAGRIPSMNLSNSNIDISVSSVDLDLNNDSTVVDNNFNNE